MCTVTMTWRDTLLNQVMMTAPSNCTGFYIISDGIRFGKRTNRAKAPDNYIFFEDE